MYLLFVNNINYLLGLERVNLCYIVSANDGLLRPFLLEILACIIGLSKDFWAQIFLKIWRYKAHLHCRNVNNIDRNTVHSEFLNIAACLHCFRFHSASMLLQLHFPMLPLSSHFYVITHPKIILHLFLEPICFDCFLPANLCFHFLVLHPQVSYKCILLNKESFFQMTN